VKWTDGEGDGQEREGREERIPGLKMVGWSNREWHAEENEEREVVEGESCEVEEKREGSEV
jgi:hypothetical protein